MKVYLVQHGVATSKEEDAERPLSDAGRLERIGQAVPIGRYAEPEEVAETVLWLLSDQASYVTGTILRVAGGR